MTTSADAGQLASLFDAFGGRVYRTAFRITGNAEDAEDVVQSVFLRLARRSPAPNLSPSPGSYLHRAAINASVDCLRHRRPADPALDDAPGEPRDAAAATPEDEQRATEIRERLRQALSDLSPRSAEIIVLSCIEGRGNKEIARLIDSTPGSVAVLLHRARQKLKDRFADLVGTEGDAR